jgi:uncharacterized protein with von Willebrand factor type A (vWA) domain
VPAGAARQAIVAMGRAELEQACRHWGFFRGGVYEAWEGEKEGMRRLGTATLRIRWVAGRY